MEDITLAIVTLGTFVFLFVVAMVADKAGGEMDAAPAKIRHEPQAPGRQAPSTTWE